MMSRTLLVTLEEEEYLRLQERFSEEQLSRAIARFLRRYTLTDEERAASYAAMAADKEREAEALAWIEAAPDDGLEDEDWSDFKPR
jgi:hypothetical protein